MPLALPPELRNRLARLVLEGAGLGAAPSCCSTSAGAAARSGWSRATRRLPSTPLTGQLYYLRRALDPYTEVREGDLHTLLSRDLSVLVLADHVRGGRAGAGQRWPHWVEKGGLLMRFAGPQTAEHARTRCCR